MIIETLAQAHQTPHKAGVQFRCSKCHEVKDVPAGTCATGYGYDADGHIVCFDCCGKEDEKHMQEHGRITLYLSGNKVTNWPGTLRYSGYVKKGRHNIAGTRYDVWFYDKHGDQWHGVQYGENTQICHCKRMKRKGG